MDPMQILDAASKGQAVVDENKARAEAKRKADVEEAVLILETLQTPGGKAIKAKIEALLEGNIVPPERFLTIRTGQNGDTFTEVNPTLVASFAGARRALFDVLAWLNRCAKIVDEEAKRKSEAH